MKKALLTPLAALGATALILTGCSSPDSSDSADSTSAAEHDHDHDHEGEEGHEGHDHSHDGMEA